MCYAEEEPQEAIDQHNHNYSEYDPDDVAELYTEIVSHQDDGGLQRLKSFLMQLSGYGSVSETFRWHNRKLQ